MDLKVKNIFFAYLDRLDMLFVVKSDIRRIQAEEVPNLV